MEGRVSPCDEEAECAEEGDEASSATAEEHGEVTERHGPDEEEVGGGPEGQVGERGAAEPRVEVPPRGARHGAPEEARGYGGREAEQKAEHGHRDADRRRHRLHLEPHRRHRHRRRRGERTDAGDAGIEDLVFSEASSRAACICVCDGVETLGRYLSTEHPLLA